MQDPKGETGVQQPWGGFCWRGWHGLSYEVYGMYVSGVCEAGGKVVRTYSSIV